MQSSGETRRESEKLCLDILLVIARESGPIQYAAAYRLKHCCLWNTGSSGQAGR